MRKGFSVIQEMHHNNFGQVEKIFKDLRSNLSDGFQVFPAQITQLIQAKTNLESFTEAAGNDFEVSREYSEFIILKRALPILRDIRLAETFIASKDVISKDQKLIVMQKLAGFRYFKSFYDIVAYFSAAILMERDPSYSPPNDFVDLVNIVVEKEIRDHDNYEQNKRQILRVMLLQLGLESLVDYRSQVEKLKTLKAQNNLKAALLEGKIFDLACIFKYSLEEMQECVKSGILTQDEFNEFESNYYSDIDDIVVDWFDDVGSRIVVFELLEKASELIDSMTVDLPQNHVFRNISQKREEYSESIETLSDVKQLHELTLLVNTKVSSCFKRSDNLQNIMSTALDFIRNRLKGEEWRYISGFIALDAIFISACKQLLKGDDSYYGREEVFEFFVRSLEFYEAFFTKLKSGSVECNNQIVREYMHLPLVSGLSKAVAVSRFRSAFRSESSTLEETYSDLSKAIKAHELMRDVLNHFAKQKEKYSIETFAGVQEDPKFKVFLVFASVEISYKKNKKKETVSNLTADYNKYIDLMNADLAKIKKEIDRKNKIKLESEKRKTEELQKYEEEFEEVLQIFEQTGQKAKHNLEMQVNRISKSSFTPRKSATNNILEMIVESAIKSESREVEFRNVYENFTAFLQEELNNFRNLFSGILRDEKLKMGKSDKRFIVPFLGSFNCKPLSDELSLFNSKLDALVARIDENITQQNSCYQHCKALHLKILKADLLLICGLNMIALHERSYGIKYLKNALEIVWAAESEYNSKLQQGVFSITEDVEMVYQQILMCKFSVVESHNNAIIEHGEFLSKLEFYRQKRKEQLGDKWNQPKKVISPEAKFFTEMKKLQNELINVETNRLLETFPEAPVVFVLPFTTLSHMSQKKNFAKMSYDDMALLKPKQFKPTVRNFEIGDYGRREILERFEKKEGRIL